MSHARCFHRGLFYLEIRNEIVTLVSVSFGKLLGVTPAVSTVGFFISIPTVTKKLLYLHFYVVSIT